MRGKHLHAGNCRTGKRCSPTYSSWQKMKARCLNKSNCHYALYGGRGIKISDEWMMFENFLMDMGVKPEGCSIDRINNDGNYEASNCRWATQKEQCNNYSRNVVITHEGVALNIEGWAKLLGVRYGTLYHRLFVQKMTLPEAIDKPYRKSRAKI